MLLLRWQRRLRGRGRRAHCTADIAAAAALLLLLLLLLALQLILLGLHCRQVGCWCSCPCRPPAGSAGGRRGRRPPLFNICFRIKSACSMHDCSASSICKRSRQAVGKGKLQKLISCVVPRQQANPHWPIHYLYRPTRPTRPTRSSFPAYTLHMSSRGGCCCSASGS